MLSKKQYLISFILVLSTVWSSWLVLNSNQQTIADQNTPESYMVDATIIRMNRDTGLPEDQLFAPYLVHYSLGDITHLTKPALTILQTTGEPWHLTADQGQAVNGSETIKLWNHVLLAQAQGPQNPPMTITTSVVTIHPKEQYAETDQTVVAKQPDKMLQALGMRTYFKTGIVDLLAKVHGEYQNQSVQK